jgi:hypothetical protein
VQELCRMAKPHPDAPDQKAGRSALAELKRGDGYSDSGRPGQGRCRREASSEPAEGGRNPAAQGPRWRIADGFHRTQ